MCDVLVAAPTPALCIRQCPRKGRDDFLRKLRVGLEGTSATKDDYSIIRIDLELPGWRAPINLSLPGQETCAGLLNSLSHKLRMPKEQLRLCLKPDTRTLAGDVTLQSLRPKAGPAELRMQLLVRLPGGKGGFGSMLRAAGGKMSSRGRKDQENNDSCRDLSGRRLGVMKEARKLAAYLEAEPERRRQMDEKMQAKYRRLEKMLGRTPKGREDFEEAARKIGADEAEMEDAVEFDSGDEESDQKEAGPSSSKPAANPAERLERFEDHEYLEQSRAIVSNARSAVAAAMAKKKKKASAGKGKEAQANL